jgi:E3 ubiquitin-protein ligase UBR4
MANDGRIYSEKMDDSTSAVNGPYYITNDVNYDDSEMLSLMENNANSNATSGPSAEAKGVSLYYSHALQLLFYTYPNGKSYVGTLENLSGPSPLTKAVLITPASSGKPAALGLAQWTEVLGHPGLIFAMGASKSSVFIL